MAGYRREMRLVLISLVKNQEISKVNEKCGGILGYRIKPPKT